MYVLFIKLVLTLSGKKRRNVFFFNLRFTSRIKCHSEQKENKIVFYANEVKKQNKNKNKTNQKNNNNIKKHCYVKLGERKFYLKLIYLNLVLKFLKR